MSNGIGRSKENLPTDANHVSAKDHRIRHDLGLCSGTSVSTLNNTGSKLQRAENYFQQKIKKNNLMLSFPLISHYFLINMC